ncbi:MAG TPA: hypothetical protein VKE74_15720 [Gemmataceae bacterium]|nr:hypothetical protein [Gemmataceae bacterium]
MAFHTAVYDVYVALGDPQAPPLWSWEVWQQFVPAIDPLIQAARGKPAVRTFQYLYGGGAVRFGRLGWTDADHRKWAHGSPANRRQSESWNLLGLEVWAPAWTACEREDRAPNVFLSLSNQAFGGGHGRELAFNPVCVLAVVSELGRRVPSLVSAGVSALRSLLSPKLLAHQRRRWGKTFGSDGFTDSIQDLVAGGLFKPGSPHTGEVGVGLLAGKWEPRPPQDTPAS